MGMFNWVDYECVCPTCHAKVDAFQTKDENGGELLCDTVKPTGINNFYTTCDKCGCWVEFDRVVHSTPNFIRTVSGKNDKVLDTKEVKIE